MSQDSTRKKRNNTNNCCPDDDDDDDNGGGQLMSLVNDVNVVVVVHPDYTLFCHQLSFPPPPKSCYRSNVYFPTEWKQLQLVFVRKPKCFGTTRKSECCEWVRLPTLQIVVWEIKL